MTIREVEELLVARLTQPLPGAEAHEPMRATPVGDVIPRFEHKGPPKPGSVLILLHPFDGLLSIPLIKRPDYMGAHSGQVSFPGGKAEPGETTVDAALREAEEEIGISRNHVRVLGQLSPFFVIPSNFMVTPVVAISEERLGLIPDAYEVKQIIHLPVPRLLHPEAIQTTEILAAGRFRMRAPHFEAEGEVVWGATAMMLNEFRWIAKEAGL
jgi:8-oxo-dGTP pyrophosphatase MutT (NUDIX family)